jgi:Domain of unknown function (DUF4258)
MDAAAKQDFIQAKATQLSIRWSSHALAELTPEGLSVPGVETALQRAKVIENYTHAHRYLPDCLVLTFMSAIEPIHAVVAINQPRDYILIVTVYRPKPEEWQNDWRTRK